MRNNWLAIWMGLALSVLGIASSLGVLFAFNGGDLALAISMGLLAIFAELSLWTFQTWRQPRAGLKPDAAEQA